MRANIIAVAGLAVLLGSAWVLPVVAQEEGKAQKGEKSEKKSEEPAKAKAEKVSGDIGLLDTEKNYMHADQTSGARGEKKQISVAQELFAAHGI